MKKISLSLTFSPNLLPLAIFLFIFCCSLLTALDFNLRPKGFVSIPMGEGNVADVGSERYSVGGGGDVVFEIDLSTIWSNPIGLGYTAGIEGGMLINPSMGDESLDSSNNYSFYSLGGALGLYYFPLSRLFTRVDGALGVYQSAWDGTKSDPGMFFRWGGEVGFRFTPGFTLAANAGWKQFQLEDKISNSGLYIGITGQITFQTGTTHRVAVSATLDQFDPVYPVFMQLYQSAPIGTVVLRNNENAEIRDVRMFFRAGDYTASEYPCGSISILQRGQSAELPLHADFSPEILRFTDSGRVLGELVIRYRFLGQEREVVRAVTVASHNRNTVSAEGFSVDAAALAAFISPTSPEVLDFARFIAGLDRANRRSGHNGNMQYAIWFIEGLRASGIRLGETYFKETEAQYPSETLLYGTGSSRDFSLLFAAGLEAVGIQSMFVSTADDLLVAVNLGVSQSAAETLFNGIDKIFIIDNEVWLPLSMSAVNEGFMACWTEGAVILDKIFNDGIHVSFDAIGDAWAIYPPAPLPALGRNVINTDNAAATREVNRVIQQYITQEINPLIQRTQGAASTPVQQNRLGMLYQRAGRVSDAKAAYERAVGLGSVPAMTNRGNIALAENDFTAAERWFRQALTREPENIAALRGLERIAGR
ncbi:MAG: tetratricopeptide repeat protein [Treponema sp.]|jgi:tetratricopeptide (TPR) repeat protein|nr:tetratricopeptide repeat protein [Treponema sp.]